jgi:glycosylphosphatidylinositol deacylase
MSGNESEEEMEAEQTEAEAEAPAGDAEQDKVKPVVFIGLFITALLCLGMLDVFQNMEPNGCAMTYMYEYPKYINIKLPEEVNLTFPKYRLLAYGEGEGKNIEKLKAEKFDGIPVLFIPGNSGSHKQVRSMASVALRKAIEESEYKVHFDYFTVDFGEEYSALYGGVLENQAQFVAHSISHILQLYRKHTPPTSVVLIGHSLGGLLAKAVLVEPNISPSMVQVIITLATPHTPVMLLDRQTHHFYHKVDTAWEEKRAGSLSHVTLVSIAGGDRDVQVRAGLTQDRQADININTHAASSVWVSTDHQCIVWCKQLVLTLNRALFDMIGPLTKQISMDKKLRKDILHYHLVHRSAGKEYQPEKLHPPSITFDKNGYWSDILKRQFTFSKGNVTCNHYSMIKIAIDEPNQRFLTLDAVHMDADDWVFGCKETKVHKNTRVCEVGENLSKHSAIIPSKGKHKAIHLDLVEVKQKHGYSHIVVHTPVYTEGTTVNIDVYNPRERRISYTVPKWINFWRQFTVVEKTVPGAVFYNISMTGIDHPWQAYTVTAESAQCGERVSMARFITPWANDATQVLLGQGQNFTNSITAKLQTPRPVGSNDSVETPQVHFYLDPACTYTIKVSPSIPKMMGQMVRYYAPLLFPCISAVIILVLAFQMRRIEGSRYCQSTILTLMTAVSPVNVVLPSRMVAYLCALGPLAAIIPKTDIQILQDLNLDFGILPIFMFFAGIGTTFLLTCLAWAAIILFGTLAHKALISWAATLTPHEVVAEVAVSTLARFPAILGCVLIAIGFATCGSLALCIGCFCYFLQVAKLYQEYLEGLVKRAVGLRDEDDPSILLAVNYQFTLALLWLMMTLLNLPTLLSWVQNLPSGQVLPTDPSIIHAVILCGSMAVLWQNQGKPRVEKKYFSVLAIILQVMAVFIGTFGMVTLYRVSFAISAVFVIVTTHQLISPDREQEEGEELEEELEEEVLAASTTQNTPEKQSTESASESEYEVEYKLNISKKKVDKNKPGVIRSASDVTDTGFGSEGLDWEYEDDGTEEISGESGKEEVI